MPDDKIIKPVRLQLSRRKGFKLVSPNGLLIVRVTRPGPLGNPYRVGVDAATAEEAVAMFRRYIEACIQHDSLFLPSLRCQLGGRNLACWCSLEPGTFCHADVLLRIANS
jgi:hypothetical protein